MRRIDNPSISPTSLVLGLGFATAISVLLLDQIAPATIDPLLTPFKDMFLAKALWNASHKVIKEIVLNPVFYAMVLGILALELWIPVDRQQKVFSVSFWQDLIWCLGDFFLKVLLLVPFTNLLVLFYRQFLSPFSLSVLADHRPPTWGILLIAVLVVDFGAWFAHFLSHKIPFLWRFHAVHHAQRELNLFTDTRFHFGDALVAYPLQLFPVFLLMIAMPSGSTYAPYGAVYFFFRIWYPRLYHANIKTNFGPFRYLLVTPQSHRIHHSIEPRHYDQNFGVVFSIWDRIFQTHYKGEHEYPATGIDDECFPVEHKGGVFELLKNYGRQLIYPLQFWRT